MTGIYVVTNLINNKQYVGQAVDIKKRWTKHRNEPYNKQSNQYNCIFYKAIRKYGIENFDFSILEECLVEELDNKEIYWIEKLNTFNNGYNMTKGGQSATVQSRFSRKDLENIKFLLQNTKMSEAEIGEKYNVSQRMISGINLGQSVKQEDWSYPLRTFNIQEKNQHYYCIDCGKEITRKATRCFDCQCKNQQVCERPSREELKQLIRTTPFTTIGKMFNVSDNAIRKWCDGYGLPRRSKDIKTYSDKEWKQL